jgi:phospholipid/cholesterol/gamma-HCH transport system substrate-binding protein
VQGLNPKDVNALTNSLIQILQGQEGSIESLFAKTSSFSNSLADNGQTVQQLIDNLNTVIATISKDGDKFSGAVDKLEKLVSGLAADKDPIGEAVTALDNGTASLTDLLGRARDPLAGTIDQLGRLAPLLDQDKELLDISIQKAPKNYRKLVRLGAYGSFLNQYLCGLSFRVSDLQGRTAYFPWIVQHSGRCGEP